MGEGGNGSQSQRRGVMMEAPPDKEEERGLGKGGGGQPAVVCFYGDRNKGNGLKAQRKWCSLGKRGSVQAFPIE